MGDTTDPTNATADNTAGVRPRIATVWLDGCSGCHMSLLDMDDRLVEILARADLVYSPLVDAKRFPDAVDVTLVEGAVATNEDEEKVRRIRRRTKVLVALGDCAVTGNVPSMRNAFDTDKVFERAFVENATAQQGRPTACLPVLLDRVRPVHEVVKVDVFVPGCPPPADAIYAIVSGLLAGQPVDPSTVTRFGK